MGDYLGTVSFLKQVAVNRAETLMRAQLLIRSSELRRLNPRTKQYDMLMGNRLFSKERIQRGQQIVHFSGEPLRSRAEVQHARAVSLHGGHVITNHTETYGLDCFQAAHPKVATQRVVSTLWIISGFPQFVWISSMFSQRRY